MARKLSTEQTCFLHIAEKLALNRSKDLKIEDADRDSLKPGEYPINFEVKVLGTLKVLPTQENVPQVHKINALRLLLLACQKLNGVTVEDLVRQLEAQTDETTLDEHAEQLGARAEKVLNEIRKATTGKRRGAVSFNGVVIPTDHQGDGFIQVYEGDGVKRLEAK